MESNVGECCLVARVDLVELRHLELRASWHWFQGCHVSHRGSAFREDRNDEDVSVAEARKETPSHGEAGAVERCRAREDVGVHQMQQALFGAPQCQALRRGQSGAASFVWGQRYALRVRWELRGLGGIPFLPRPAQGGLLLHLEFVGEAGDAGSWTARYSSTGTAGPRRDLKSTPLTASPRWSIIDWFPMWSVEASVVSVSACLQCIAKSRRRQVPDARVSPRARNRLFEFDAFADCMLKICCNRVWLEAFVHSNAADNATVGPMWALASLLQLRQRADVHVVPTWLQPSFPRQRFVLPSQHRNDDVTALEGQCGRPRGVAGASLPEGSRREPWWT